MNQNFLWAFQIIMKRFLEGSKASNEFQNDVNKNQNFLIIHKSNINVAISSGRDEGIRQVETHISLSFLWACTKFIIIYFHFRIKRWKRKGILSSEIYFPVWYLRILFVLLWMEPETLRVYTPACCVSFVWNIFCLNKLTNVILA